MAQRPDLIANILDLSFLPSSHFNEVIAHDVLEHLERGKTVPALGEWTRLVAQGGTLEIRIPSLEVLFSMISKPTATVEEIKSVIHFMYGTQAYSGDYHLTSFTARLIQDYVSSVGLTVCEAGYDGGWCWLVKARKVGKLTNATEMAHNSYFRILQRGPDESEAASLAARITQDKLTQDQVDAVLDQSIEAQVLKDRSAFLRHLPLSEHWQPISVRPPLTARALAKGKRVLFGQDSLRSALGSLVEIARNKDAR
jgi:hypothetical protein